MLIFGIIVKPYNEREKEREKKFVKLYNIITYY